MRCIAYTVHELDDSECDVVTLLLSYDLWGLTQASYDRGSTSLRRALRHGHLKEPLLRFVQRLTILHFKPLDNPVVIVDQALFHNSAVVEPIAVHRSGAQAHKRHIVRSAVGAYGFDMCGRLSQITYIHADNRTTLRS